MATVTAFQAKTRFGQLLDRVAAGSPLVVPTLWTFEVANSLVVLLRRKKLVAAERDRAMAASGRLPLVVDEDGTRHALGRNSELAVEHGLSVYDATYLELAIRRKLPLASRDEALRKASRGCRIELLLWRVYGSISD